MDVHVQFKQTLTNAYDMVLFNRNIQDLQQMIDSVNTYSNENNLYISFTKNKDCNFQKKG